MRCRNCGTEIADKALICYRCGTATTEAKFKPPAPSDRGSWSKTLIVAGVVLVLLIVLAIVFFVSRSNTASGRLEFDDPKASNLENVSAVLGAPSARPRGSGAGRRGPRKRPSRGVGRSPTLAL
jgi:zinc ribbon protein